MHFIFYVNISILFIYLFLNSGWFWFEHPKINFYIWRFWLHRRAAIVYYWKEGQFKIFVMLRYLF